MPKTNLLKSAAIFVLALGIVSGVAYAGIKITEIFKIKGIDDTGIQTALQNAINDDKLGDGTNDPSYTIKRIDNADFYFTVRS